ncbi:response regulator [Dongshaea marina]|uniref:response regulator n=1 Tax=Dongshaea marina TaxID=2047966 RepID=UPI000D3E5E7F|nr:response regulator [Dongshaea marina]
MNRVLLIEDGSTLRKLLKQVIQEKLGIPVDACETMAEAVKHLNECQDYFAALVDLHLPDSPDGEVIDEVLKHKLPTIVLTGDFDETKSQEFLKKGALDYIIKDSHYSFKYALKLLDRLRRNQYCKILMVDDSATSRTMTSKMLKRQLFPVLEAEDGLQALELLEKHKDIRLVLTDYNMPIIDGFELVRSIRSQFDNRAIAIVGISGSNDKALSAKFIKHGADDFITKPFVPEELQCRIFRTLETMELMEEIKQNANRDHLTQVYNRGYMYEYGEPMLKRARDEQSDFSLAVVDIDNLKDINESYGHRAGDAILKQLANALKTVFSKCTTIRLGSEDFCLIMPGLDNQTAQERLNKLKERMEQSAMNWEGDTIWFSFSAGVTSILADTLEKQLDTAVLLLREAKESGRNLVVGDD